MRSALHAWEVVCPDGLVRHLPYINRGDALCDAEVNSGEGCGISVTWHLLDRQ